MEKHPELKIGERVQVVGKPEVRQVCAAYRVENFTVYELSGLPDFLIKAGRLQRAGSPSEKAVETL